MSHAGLLYGGVDARPEAVQWRVDGADLVIVAAGGEERLPLAGLRASTRVGNTRRAVYLPDHRQLQTDDNAAVDAAFGRRGVEALTDRLERHAGAAVASVVATVVLAAGFTVYGLPWAAERVARALPPSVEVPLGEQVLGLLDSTVLEPTTLDAATRDHYTRVFDAFQAKVPGGGYRVDFRQMDDLPNAFALPGGTIVFTDGLMELVEEDEDFLAVAAHEIGHQQERHTLRAVLQQSTLLVALAVLSGDVSGVSGVVLGVPSFLLDNHYSREFETEADARAFEYLQAQGISPAWFARIMARMESAGAEGDDLPAEDAGEEAGPATWASTHPPTAARQRRALELGRDLPPPGRLIADRGAERLAAGDAAALPVLDAGVLTTGCWSGDYEEDEASVRWWQRYRPDGTLRLLIERTSDEPDEPVAVDEFGGFWAVQGGALVEYVQFSPPESGELLPGGNTNRYLVRFPEPADRVFFRSPTASEDSQALAVSCPDELS
jgi:Zn-dependent protease with chaperone function